MKRLFTLLLLALCIQAQAQTYTPTAENMKAREWFKDAKFGLFIHWGVFSIPGRGEWVMNNENIKVDTYTKLKDQFNPVKFDAKAWVSMAKNAGMKYITLITRHHDGFSQWDTKASDFNIMNTPYHKDIVKQLADECHKQNIKLFLYYSLLDWRRNDYSHTTGRTGKGTGRTVQEDWNNYIKFMKQQLTELLTNYGPIAGIWFDGHWDQMGTEKDHDFQKQQERVNWHYNEIYGLIHKLQPAALIGNNHHLSPKPGEDFQMFERDLPGENKSGLSGQSVSSLPLETCETINGSWGYDSRDKKHKTDKELVHLLVRAAGNGANLLLNIGPKPDGEIQPEFQERLAAMGKWLKTYGKTIYNTQGGYMKPQKWGAITQSGKKVYVHLLDLKENSLKLESLPFQVKSAQVFGKGTKIAFEQKGNTLQLQLGGIDHNQIDTVIELSI